MDPKEVENMLRSRGAKAECPSCGDNNWKSVDGNPDLALLFRHNFKLALTVAPMICHNCGFVRLHAVEALTPKPPARDS